MTHSTPFHLGTIEWLQLVTLSVELSGTATHRSGALNLALELVWHHLLLLLLLLLLHQVWVHTHLTHSAHLSHPAHTHIPAIPHWESHLLRITHHRLAVGARRWYRGRDVGRWRWSKGHDSCRSTRTDRHWDRRGWRSSVRQRIDRRWSR